MDPEILRKAYKRSCGDSGDSEASTSSKSQWTHEEMDNMQDKLKLTDTQLIGMGTELRKKEGRAAVEPNLREHLVEKKQILADFFSAELVEYEKGERDKDIIIVPTIFCSDIMGLIR